MISIKYNTADFFEKEKGDIYIYGAANAGYWVAYYLNKCGIKFEGFIDKAVIHSGALFAKSAVYAPCHLQSLYGTIRVIITPENSDSVIADMIRLQCDKNADVVCLLPHYPLHHKPNEKGYNINRFLGYFRRKLLKGTVPTFISNDCTAGKCYEMLDAIPSSPTINSIIFQEDYIKLCSNPEHYLRQNLSDIHWAVFNVLANNRHEVPAGIIDDVEILFVYTWDYEKLEKQWKLMKERINWEKLVFIMSDATGAISFPVAEEFSKLKRKHILMLKDRASLYIGQKKIDIHFGNSGFFFMNNDPIENHFDFLGWLNDVEY